MDFKKYILNKLLDRFEESKHFTGEAKINRKIVLNFTSTEFSEYNIENFDIKSAIHAVVSNLQEKGIITVEWLPFENNNIIKRVVLNLEKVDEGYSEIHRINKSNILNDFKLTLLEHLRSVKTTWIKEFFKYNLDFIERKSKLSRYIPQDKRLLLFLLETIKFIDVKDDEEILERVFSKKYLGNSKIFEQKVRRRLITILRNFYIKDDLLEDSEILSYVGFIKSSEETLFHGPLKISLAGEIIDYVKFIYGASINSDTIKSFQVESLKVSRVITIENKANFLEYVKNKSIKDELVIYLAGFYSPIKKAFLQKIYCAAKSNSDKTEYYHWGDIDIGGFRIFKQLRNEIIEELKPLYMDVETFEKYMSYGEGFDKLYSERLKSLLQKESYKIFWDLIKAMLEKRIKLEQEALL